MATRGKQSDPGLLAVRKLYQTMNVDEAWSVQTDRGYTWWGHELAQRIWAEEAVVRDGVQTWRVVAEADVARSAGDPIDWGPIVSPLMGLASLNALVRSPEGERLRLRCSVLLERDDWEATWPFFAIAAAMQAAEAARLAGALSCRADLEPDRSRHPTSGPRPDRDDMLNVIENIVLPQGWSPSAWGARAEFARLARTLAKGGAVATAGAHGFTAQFPLGEPTAGSPLAGPSALLVVETRDRHPILGHGLTLRLHLPVWAEGDALDALPLALNERERDSETASDLLGSWCLGPNPTRRGVLFVAHVPNALFFPDRIDRVIGSLVNRARWLSGPVLQDLPGDATADQGWALSPGLLPDPAEGVSYVTEEPVAPRARASKKKPIEGASRTRSPRRSRKAEPVDRVLLYGEDPGLEALIFIPRDEASALAACYEVKGTAITWGELRTRLAPHHYESCLMRHGISEPRDDEPVDWDAGDRAESRRRLHAVQYGNRNGAAPGYWPSFPAQRMLTWVPAALRRLGEVRRYSVDGEYLHFDPEEAEEFVAAFEAAGYSCVASDPLFLKAQGIEDEGDREDS